MTYKTHLFFEWRDVEGEKLELTLQVKIQLKKMQLLKL